MVVVADSSAIILLAKIELLDLLPQLFGNIVVPSQVASELHGQTSQERAPPACGRFAELAFG